MRDEQDWRATIKFCGVTWQGCARYMLDAIARLEDQLASFHPEIDLSDDGDLDADDEKDWFENEVRGLICGHVTSFGQTWLDKTSGERFKMTSAQLLVMMKDPDSYEFVFG